MVKRSIGRGVSQSGNFLRGWLHLGFNQDESGEAVHDGLWPIIAGRRIALNFRWAQPDGVLELYQAGSEGPQWWLPHPDPVRGLPAAGILDRCTASRTCPKVIEHFGSAEVWALKLTPEWVGTDAAADLPLPESVRRYYIAQLEPWRRRRRLRHQPARRRPADRRRGLPGQQLRHRRAAGRTRCRTPRRSTPSASTSADWVMDGTPPPPSRYPTLAQGHARPGPEDGARHAGAARPAGRRCPRPTSSCRCSTTTGARDFNPQDGSGVPANAVPPIRRVLKMLAPKVDADGNELGGVPVVLRDAPLGTYLGWNVTAGGERPFHAGQICNYVGGMLPFARTAAERQARGDARLSLEERYGSHDGYVEAVRRAAARAVKEGFLLEADAAALISAAQASQVLK